MLDVSLKHNLHITQINVNGLNILNKSTEFFLEITGDDDVRSWEKEKNEEKAEETGDI